MTGLTNVGQDFQSQNVSILNGFARGAAFSAVYNSMTGQFLAYPSGDSRLLNGLAPDDLVARRGGHAVVNQQFSRLTGADPTSNVGLTMFLEEDGSISIEWRSASVNGLNSSFTGDLVPESLRPQIIEDLGNAINRTVRERCKATLASS